MKLAIATSHDFAEKVAKRWGLQLGDRIAENNRSLVYKASDPKGIYALKLLKTFGNSGEGGAKLFLDNLPPGLGPRMHRVNLSRTAFLMDWLEGPTLAELIADGRQEEALDHLADSAARISQVRFRYPWLFHRVTPKLVKSLDKAKAQMTGPQTDADLLRAIDLLKHLTDTMRDERIIHGDLGFANVILTPAGPQIIDPKGYLADPAYECCTFVVPSRSDLTIADCMTTAQNRASRIAPAINQDPNRLIGWGAVALARRIFMRDPTRKEAVEMKPYLRASLDLAEA